MGETLYIWAEVVPVAVEISVDSVTAGFQRILITHSSSAIAFAPKDLHCPVVSAADKELLLSII